MVDQQRLRRMFLWAFQAEGMDYVDGGCQVAHRSVTWTISLVVDGSGTRSPYRLVLGASLASVVRYAREVDSLDEVRARYRAGDYDEAFVIAPLRQLLEGAS